MELIQIMDLLVMQKIDYMFYVLILMEYCIFLHKT